MIKDLLYNTSKLVKFNFKKDKKYVSIWIIALTLITIMIGFYYVDSSLSEAEAIMMVESLSSPAMKLIVGVVPNAQPTSGLIFALEMTLFCAMIVGIMNIFLVTRNTRNDEENGRFELIRSMKVGRLSLLASSLIQAFIVNLILALAISLGLCLIDFGPNSINSAFLYGTIMGATGFMFATITAIFAQIFQSNRTVILSSFAFLFINFIFRGITDINNPVLSWISPLSWTYKTEVYVNNIWFPMFLMIALSIVGILISLYLNSLRDLDGSFIKQKPGKKHASNVLVKPLGLVTRLNKTTLVAWIVGIAVLGLTLGSIFGDLETFFSGNERLQAMFPNLSGAELAKEFIGMISTIITIVLTIPLLIFIGKMHSEEKKNHMENIVSKKITRNKILGSYLTFTLISSVLFVLIAIFSIFGAGHTTINFNDIFQGIITFIPAVIFMIGIGVFIIGIIPKLFSIVWIILGYAFFITYFGEMLKMPNWLMGLSPFHHIPLIPAEELKVLPLIILSGLGIILILIGFKAYRERDITA